MTKKKTFWLKAYQETVEDRKQGPDFKLIEYLDIIPKGWQQLHKTWTILDIDQLTILDNA